MMTDTKILQRGVQVLAQYLGDIEMERFIALIQREPFDYTHWRQQWVTEREEESIEAISRQAMALRAQHHP
ncbi:hypothetical protein E4P82_15200 [Candidatus Competibacter phosphatis]|uniref:Uncharacterized protein n=2 Tax=Candidatus Competibacter phosphatis TaxID=221280 RepID=A0ABX1TR68_9GAMM|nr:hypothetical protein [Candidatus Competibacter phosphatis]